MKERGRFDERCPHCTQNIAECLHELNVEMLGEDVWPIDCPHCGKVVIVTVHMVPEFELETPEQADAD